MGAKKPGVHVQHWHTARDPGNHPFFFFLYSSSSTPALWMHLIFQDAQCFEITTLVGNYVYVCQLLHSVMATKRRIGGYINSNNFTEHFILPFFGYVVEKSRLMEIKLRRKGELRIGKHGLIHFGQKLDQLSSKLLYCQSVAIAWAFVLVLLKL
jgi:hypothetical protein